MLGNDSSLIGALNSIAQAIKNATTLPSGEWKEIGRQTWTSGGTLSVSGLSGYKYLKFELVDTQTSSNGSDFTFNGDSSANYAYARSLINSAFSTVVNQNNLEYMGNYNGTQRATMETLNIQGHEKTCFIKWITAPRGGAQNSAAQEPALGEYAAKWVNTTSLIESISVVRRSTNFAAGSELIAYGHN